MLSESGRKAVLSEMESLEQEAGDAIHESIMQWCEEQAIQRVLPAELVAAAAGKALLTSGAIFMGNAKHLTAKASLAILRDTLDAFGKAKPGA